VELGGAESQGGGEPTMRIVRPVDEPADVLPEYGG
jgi:hypothetical protein